MSTQPIPQPQQQYQYVKLPDGSYGKFASDASDDVIKATISKDFPQAFSGNGTVGQGQASNPSLWQRFKDFIGADDNSLTQQAQASYKAKNGKVGMPGVSDGPGLAEGLAAYDSASGGEMAGGAADIARGDIAKGAHRIISGGGAALTPVLPFVAAAAPLATARAMTGGVIGSKLAGGAASLFGATPDQSDLAGDMGGILGGARAGKANLPPISQTITETIPQAAGRATGRIARAFATPPSTVTKLPATFEGDVEPILSGGLDIQKASQIQNLFTPPAALPPGPIELPASTAGEVLPPETPQRSVQPAAVRLVFDKQKGAARTQFLTSTAPTIDAPQPAPSPGQPPAYRLPNATYLRDDMQSLSQRPPVRPLTDLDRANQALRDLREHDFISRVQEEMNRQDGDVQGQNFLDSWMQEHNQQAPGAKKAPGLMNKTAQPQPSPAPVPPQTPPNSSPAPVIVTMPDPNARPTLLQRGTVPSGPVPLQMSNALRYLLEEPSMNDKPEIVNNDTDLEDVLRRSLLKVDAQKARAQRGY